MKGGSLIRKKVIILGAGPAGLSAGWKLSQQGVQVDIIEKDSLCGGLCRSVKKDGFIFDLGGHRFITKNKLLLAEIETLMGEELVVRPRKSVIRLRGQFFSYPLVITDVLMKMNPLISLKSGFDFILTRCGKYSRLSDHTFENWIVKRFGRTLYDIYFGPYSHKLWGIPPSEISSAWGAQRISLINIGDIFLRMLGKKKDMPKTYAENFLYPKQGIGQIADRMAEEIIKAKGTLHLNAMVKKVVCRDRQIDHIVYTQEGKEKKISGDFVVSTIPLPEFAMSIIPEIDAPSRAVSQRMPFRSIIFLHLMLNREFVTDNTWIYIPEAHYLFFRIQDRRNWSSTTVPIGKNALTLEIACTKDDALWRSSDEDIYNRCIDDLERLKLIRRNDVLGYFTEKIDYAYPIYTLDYAEKVNSMYALLRGIENFISIGRQGLYRYNNMDHSLEMGILTAKHILQGYPRQKILDIATENAIFDWQDAGYHDGNSAV